MNWFAYYFKKSSLFRFIFFIFLLVVIFVSVFFILRFSNGSPEITSVSPVTVSDGETVIIRGSNFGTPSNKSLISLGNYDITASKATLWTDTEIRFEIPKKFITSLFYISANGVNSNYMMLTAKDSLPIVSKEKTNSNLPEIVSLSSGSGTIGKLITLEGQNFGAFDSSSQVLFTKQVADVIGLNSARDLDGIPCLESNFDFISWSDTKIQVRVPEGAETGNIVVANANGLSNPVSFMINHRVGSKKITNKRTYILKLESNLSNFQGNSSNILFVSMPVPVVSTSQGNFKVISSEPQPLAVNYQGGIIHRFENLRSDSVVSTHQEVSIETYDVATKINPVNVPVTIKSKPELLIYTRPNAVIPSDAEYIIKLSESIVKNSKNPYNNARSVYNYIIKNIKPKFLSDVNTSHTLEYVIESGFGDSYDISTLFCALLRAVGIPTVPVGGIVVDINQNSHIHWWAEFYVENVGWIPVDPAMALGLPFNEKMSLGNSDDYFGQINGDHIAFSRDVLRQTQMISDSKIVNKERSYALRDYWEETSGLTAYTSFWAVPKVIAIY